MSSNLNQAVEKGLSISKNLYQLWVSSAYNEKQKLQYLVFPEGMCYDKENKVVLTNRANSLIAEIALQQSVVDENKNGNLLEDYHFGSSVGRTGFEPATPWSQTKYSTGLNYLPCRLKFLQVLKPAVREGVEPSVQFDPYGSLANYWF